MNDLVKVFEADDTETLYKYCASKGFKYTGSETSTTDINGDEEDGETELQTTSFGYKPSVDFNGEKKASAWISRGVLFGALPYYVTYQVTTPASLSSFKASIQAVGMKKVDSGIDSDGDLYVTYEGVRFRLKHIVSSKDDDYGDYKERNNFYLFAK